MVQVFVSIPENRKNNPFNFNISDCMSKHSPKRKLAYHTRIPKTPQTLKQPDQTRKDNASTAQTEFIILPVNWILSQLAVSVGICGFKHVRFDTVPLQQLRAVANHPHISLGSNHFPLIPFNNLTTLITLINVASSTTSLKRPAGAGVNDRYQTKVSEPRRTSVLYGHGGNRSDHFTNGWPSQMHECSWDPGVPRSFVPAPVHSDHVG